VSRLEAGGEALMSLSLDDAVAADILSDIAKIIGASYARAVNIHAE
jgi:D-3-phosphoglycerate dehydrogenase